MSNYFAHPYCSNSDLTRLRLDLAPSQYQADCYDAFRMGTLLDAMITEPHLVDYFKRTVIGTEYSYTDQEIEMTRAMRRAFHADPFCAQLLKHCQMQKEIYREAYSITHAGVTFTLDMRCKFDLYSPQLGMGPDIKSTTATTQKQFEEAARYFDYPRQRAVYMGLGDFYKDVLIGVSKKAPHKVFKIFIRKGDDFHNAGQQQFEDLAFKYWSLKPELV